jgi:hypothetical protein
MSKVRDRKRPRRRVRIGAPDPSVTGSAGVAVLAELIDRLGMMQALDTAVGPIKQRDRGISAGGLLIAVAQAQLCGEEYLVGCDRRRADTVAEQLSAVPTPASTTAASLARRLSAEQWLSVEDGLAEVARRVLGLLPASRRAMLQQQPATVDLDTTDTEVYGRAKSGVSFNHQGQRVGRTHLATWAQAGVALAMDLRDGRSDPRTYSSELMERALASLARIGVYRPADPHAPRPRFRMDSGYLSGRLAWAAARSPGRPQPRAGGPPPPGATSGPPACAATDRGAPQINYNDSKIRPRTICETGSEERRARRARSGGLADNTSSDLFDLLDGQDRLLPAVQGLPQDAADQCRRGDLLGSRLALERAVELVGDPQRQRHLQRGRVLRGLDLRGLGLLLGILLAHRAHLGGDRRVVGAPRRAPGFLPLGHRSSCPS